VPDLPQQPVPGQSAHNCHWSVPTLFMPAPYWVFAWSTPWCCWNDHEIIALRSTEGCVDCRLWRARQGPPGAEAGVRPDGAVPPPDPASARVRIGDGYGRRTAAVR